MKKIFFILILFTLPFVAGAQVPEFTPLAGIPGVNPGSGTLSDYLNALFILLISVSAIIAVVKITIAGITYMTSEASIGSKGTAKADIQASLVGLLIILASYIILRLINPELLDFDILSLLPSYFV